MDDNCYRLCYVEGPWAYFTAGPLAEEWGDDWDDAPYQFNAGRPYGRRGLCKLAWDGPFETPADLPVLSLTVQDINAGILPWLTPEGRTEPIYAGDTIEEFKHKMRAAGGQIYALEDCHEPRRSTG